MSGLRLMRRAFMNSKPPGLYRYLRFAVAQYDAGYLYINEIYWIVGATDYPTSAMTANAAPSPLVASAVNAYAGSPWQAFDKDSATQSFRISGGSSGGASITLDLGAGTLITPTGLGLAWPGGTGLTKFTCYGSASGAFAGEQALLYTSPNVASGYSANTRYNFTF